MASLKVDAGSPVSAKSWSELSSLCSTYKSSEDPSGPFSHRSKLRLFGSSEKSRVVLYRDRHAWCPYCQKVLLWLELRRVPYAVRHVTMRCYGKKEAWYTAIVPSGMLPAIELDGKMITESDDILIALEAAYGPLPVPSSEGGGATASMTDPSMVSLRALERRLFRSWCNWLCHPEGGAREAAAFAASASAVEAALAERGGPFFLGRHMSVAEPVFVPYLERMVASLFYYKGYNMLEKHPRIKAFFQALHSHSEAYRLVASDAHTHAHDLPPQMGGCYTSGIAEALAAARIIDEGPWPYEPLIMSSPAAASSSSPVGAAREEAIYRVMRHAAAITAVNADSDKARFDAALRCALTNLANTGTAVPPAAQGGANSSASASSSDSLATGSLVSPPKGSASGLRYLRDRINVPRDMCLDAANLLRSALERTAALDGPAVGPAIPLNHRYDQDSTPFALK